ncbi:hypothetical protein Tco_0211100 [Tanacetum coccineum]
MTTLVDKAILSGVDNRPPMLEKDMYDSWKSRMKLYMMNRQHGRMILESVENGSLIWPLIEEYGVTRPKKYFELFATEEIQAYCDVKATNIILQGLPPEVYALCKLYDEFDKFAYKKGETLRLTVPVFQRGDDLIDVINYVMSFLTAVVTSRYPTTNNQLRYSSNPRQQATINNGRVTLQPIQGRQTSLAAGTSRTYTPGASGSNYGKQRTVICYNYKGECHMSKQCTKPKRKRDDSWFKDKVLLVQAQESGQILHEEELAFLADPGIPEDALAEVAIQNRNQATQTVDNASVKKAQQLEPKLYAGNVIMNANAIVIPESEETLMLAEEIRSKRLLKQQDPMMLEKKVNTTPVDYAALNQLSQDFEKRFVPQTKLYAKQSFWSQNSVNSTEPTLSSIPTIVEVPKELPKVSMVNTSLKKLKYQLAALKDLFNTFDQYLIDELSEVQNVFNQMEQAMEQHRLELKTFEVKINQVFNENERLLEHVISKDIVNIIVNYTMDNASVKVNACEKCLKLENELLNKMNFVEKETYDKLFKSFTTLEKHCISLEVDSQLNQEIFQRDNSVSNQINLKSVEISDLNACLQEKVLVITTLKDELRKLKGKDLANNEVTHHPSDPEINTEPITPKLLNKRSAHSAYIKHTQEEAAVLRDLVDHIKANYPLDPTLESACKYTKLIQELLSKISKTCPSINNSGEQLVAVTPMNKVKRVRFTEPVTSSRNTITKKASTSNLASNKPMLSSTGVKPSTSASGSQPSGNTKKDKILSSMFNISDATPTLKVKKGKCLKFQV